MNNAQFDSVLEKRIDLIKSVLSLKANEYAVSGDRMHNFKRAAEVLATSPEMALVGMWIKHIVSVLDLVTAAHNDKNIQISMLEEKIGDSINYLILLEAMLKEKNGGL